jgi:hypothetical protein
MKAPVIGLIAALSALTACGIPGQCYRSRPGEGPAENECRRFASTDPGTDPRALVAVSGDIAADTLWTAANRYLLKDFVFVRAPAALTIEPGTTILGERGSALVITRGAKIHAVGTPERPIVFTSSKPPGARYRGDWGGLNLLGAAPINVSGGETALSGVPIAEGRGFFGGSRPDDSSGPCATCASSSRAMRSPRTPSSTGSPARAAAGAP